MQEMFTDYIVLITAFVGAVYFIHKFLEYLTWQFIETYETFENDDDDDYSH